MPVLEIAKQDGLVWTPIYTLPRNEKKVHELCLSKGFSSYLPLKKDIKIRPVHSKGRSYAYKREQWLPMFPGYVFAQLSPDFYLEVYRNRSVLRLLNTVGPMEDVLIRELQLLQKVEALSQEQEIAIVDQLTEGQHVRLIAGDFAGWEGIVLHAPGKNNMVVLNITTIQSAVELQYPADWCELIDA